MTRYICIHGHFYQPPRENPWLESIEQQGSADPFHNWNERITEECYRANAFSRILDPDFRIRRIVNNYARISFNFGPTLLSYLEQFEPDVYGAILQADRESQSRYSGHGSALAQAYNHMILPLANRRDRITQVVWGIEDFRRRFGRAPEGMWLAESAVDLESLDIMAERGIRFTILAPNQAHRIRRIGARDWHDVSGGHIDPTRAYEVRLPSGRTMGLFFYDGPVSQAIAFEKLLTNGAALAERVGSAFSDDRSWSQLVHLCTDGESYGHHHRHGDMALAFALQHIEEAGLGRLTNYGEFLALHPPTHEVQIWENSSWSCVHGIGRWCRDCGCNSGGYPGWNQQWRQPYRSALDWLRDELSTRFEDAARELVRDPWQARDAYVAVVSERTAEARRRFLRDVARRELAQAEQVQLWQLLELQRNAMLMYTSCGWFFDELSGIETVQTMRYACRAIELAERLFHIAIEPEFLERLAQARSNIPAHGTGREIYATMVRPSVTRPDRLAAQYTVEALFDLPQDPRRIFCYDVDRVDFQLHHTGTSRVCIACLELTSRLTLERSRFDCVGVDLGENHVFIGLHPHEARRYKRLARQIPGCFLSGSRAEMLERFRAVLGEAHVHDLDWLPAQVQQSVLVRILEAALAEANGTYRQLYQRQAPLMKQLVQLNLQVPETFLSVAETVLSRQVRDAAEQSVPDLERIRDGLEEARRWALRLDPALVARPLQRAILTSMQRLVEHPFDADLLRQVDECVRFAHSQEFDINLFDVQNLYFSLLNSLEANAGSGPSPLQAITHEWFEDFVSLGELLGFSVQWTDQLPLPAVPLRRESHETRVA